MDENYWKEAYKNTWDQSSERENRLKAYLERLTGKNISDNGLGAGTSDYIVGSARRNGYQKGDADLVVDGTNIYIEITGPLVTSVKSTAPLWFRPDKVNNAVKNYHHDVFFAHHCMSADLWRIIHVDEEFKKRFRSYEFEVVYPYIRGRKERYVEIQVSDRCIRDLDYLIEYIRIRR
jgi:hypothetical protein